MISRRSFLLGLGSLVTSAFVARATAHVFETGHPLLLDPGRAEETLYVYDFPAGYPDEASYNKWRISLGPYQDIEPPPPTWREYLKPRGYTFETAADYDRAYREMSLLPEEVDRPLDRLGWASEWEHFHSPQAKAYVLLQELGLDCGLNKRGEKAGRIEFVDGGWHPGSCERWVELRDDLSVSLLQARLIERELPVRIVESDEW